MKIAFIGQKGIPAKQGGVEKHVEELSIRLAEADFDVFVYSRPYYTGIANKKYKGVSIINLPSIKTKNLDAISHTFLASIHAIFQRYDIIHYHGVGPSLLSWIPRIFSPRTKVIVTFHCLDRQHQKWSLPARLMLTLGEWTACHFPHQTITVSRALQMYCKEKYNTEAIYIPNGFSSHGNGKKSDVLKQYQLKKGGYFIAVSRLVQHKGIHTLIEAYKKIHTTKKLVIVGSGFHNGNYAEMLVALAKGNKKIIFTGEQTGSNLQTLFKNAYSFIQPSESEGLSIALLEAMSYGIPVIISNIKENSEAVKGNGLAFQNKNSQSLAQQLNYSLRNQKQIQKMATLAKKQTTKEYNWPTIIKQMISLYESLSYTDRNNRFTVRKRLASSATR